MLRVALASGSSISLTKDLESCFVRFGSDDPMIDQKDRKNGMGRAPTDRCLVLLKSYEPFSAAGTCRASELQELD
jgi:hypothetical protein